jgi:hypothetical protein
VASARLRLGQLLLSLSVPADAPRHAPEPAHRPSRRARDRQRGRVYRWEQAHVFPVLPGELQLDACRALVGEAYRLMLGPAASPPLVTDGRGRRHACGSRQVIKLPRWARTRAIVLHEAAHGFADDAHGPQFVRAYVELLIGIAALDRLQLYTTLRAARVAIAPADWRPRA